MYNMDISILGFKFRAEILILIFILWVIMSGHIFCSCCKVNLMEGFAGASTNDGESSSYTLGMNDKVNTSTWGMPNLVVTPGKPLTRGVQNILNRKQQPIPLPKGELDMFATTEFKPGCCPNTYSNSTGCACMTTGQYNYLIERGGNNVPYSEY